MASSPFFNLSNQNQVCRSVSDKNRGCSKAQMCLKKIIDIISSRSSLRPCENSQGLSQNPKFESEVKGLREKSRTLCCRKRGFDIDLNLAIVCVPETKESVNQRENEGLSACSGVGEADGRVCGVIVNYNSSSGSGDVSMVEKSSEGECDPKEVGNSTGDFPEIETNLEEERKLVEEETREFSEIMNLQVQNIEIETKRVCEEIEDGELNEIEVEEERQQIEEEEEEDQDERKSETEEYNSEGYLGLLVEAAKLVSRNFEDDEDDPDVEKPSPSVRFRHEAEEESQKRTENETTESMRCRSKRNRCWMLDLCGGFEDISPVVRSKRGRSQVLPYRYRDSVLEPWKRLSKQRSSRVSTKPRTQ